MNSLVVYHFTRSGNQDLEKDLSCLSFMKLSTCQRVLVFVSEQQEETLSSQISETLTYERLSGLEMYQFLLEVICGLKSSLLGETEIQGQFKNFIKSEQEDPESEIHRWNSTFQSLLFDAKEVRQSYLKDLGSHSYGSLTRKILKEVRQVSVLGAGQLAAEIEPWFGTKEVTFFSRKSELPSLSAKAKGPRNADHLNQVVKNNNYEAMVVAAPLDNSSLIEMLKGAAVNVMIDWRGENHLSDQEIKQLKIKNYFSFHQLMTQLSEEKLNLQKKLVPALDLIAKKSEAFSAKAIIRPLGWDDLCA